MIGAAFLAASVFEPVVAIDPARPDLIVAGAQYGDGFNRGGLLFRTLVTNDGGRNWARQEIVLRELDGPPTMAADLSLVFGLEGELYGLGISGEGLRDRVPEAALALGVSRDGGRSFAPRALLGESIDHPDGSFSVSDKPWMAIDRGVERPFRGSLYFAWTRIRVKKLPDGYDLDGELVFSFSRDSGRSALASELRSTQALAAATRVKAILSLTQWPPRSADSLTSRRRFLTGYPPRRIRLGMLPPG